MIIDESLKASATRGEAPAVQVMVLAETNSLLERIAVALEAIAGVIVVGDRHADAEIAAPNAQEISDDLSDSEVLTDEGQAPLASASDSQTVQETPGDAEEPLLNVVSADPVAAPVVASGEPVEVV